jgi:predicted nucleic acid-binding protein
MPDVFLDTDVSFDILSKREPHYTSSLKLLELAANGSIQLMISESSLANLYYLCFDIYKIKNAQSILNDFISACEIVQAGKDSILLSLHSPFKDKEDALQYYTALRAEADYFITRNKKDYKHGLISLPVYSPAEFIRLSEF